ncbi:Rho guanine nucleotide exchange factor [Stygiomarasmius scandens]|uniref:Rho guanine nucleotide exchange factor n=1 Tax=Marasmiellus scandens TaxID=2682957 RepID=A0ABR1JT01_9AGAR
MSLTSLLGRTKTFPQEQPSYAQNFFDGPSIASADALRVSKRVEWILNDRDAYRRLLAQRGELAQSLLDLLQTLCDYPEVTSELRSRIYKAIIRLSKNSGLSPVCLTLNNITNLEDFPVAGGAFADIRKGLLGGQVACLKIPRLHLGQDPNKLLKVIEF